MKFNRGSILSVFIMLTYILNISNVCAASASATAKVSSSLKAKRQQSMMEYLHKNFISSDNAELAKAKKSQKNMNFKEVSRLRKRNKVAEKKREEEEEKEEEDSEAEQLAGNNTQTMAFNATVTPGLNPNTTANSHTTTPVLETWFMISSKGFLDQNRFPPIQMGGKKTMSIKTDILNFRINGAYGNKNLAEKLPNDKFFWFRLSGLNLYYSTTASDINILGAVSVESIDHVLTPMKDSSTEFITTCFTVKDAERIEWKICGMQEATVKLWFCQLKSFLNITDTITCPENVLGDADTPAIIKKTVEITQAYVIVPLETPMCNEGWNYKKFGSDWECDCKDGHQQSPIDLPRVDAALESSIKPQMEYSTVNNVSQEPTVDESIGKDGKLKIILKENLLRIFADKFGRIVTMDGSIFHANEINLHSPSEHKIDGKQYDFEVTILHSGVSVGDIAKQASLSFLFEKAPGKYNGFIEDLDYFDLPNTLNHERYLKNPVSVQNIFKTEESDQVGAMSPFSFYTYQGSLTTPPCTEDTIVYVASKPLQISSTALELFKESTRIPDMMDNRGNVIISDSTNDSARIVQPLKGRPVFFFDHTKTCGPAPPVIAEAPSGHYEKIRKAFTSYFYVSNDKPSGLPNAWVISEDEAKGKGNKPSPQPRI